LTIIALDTAFSSSYNFIVIVKQALIKFISSRTPWKEHFPLYRGWTMAAFVLQANGVTKIRGPAADVSGNRNLDFQPRHTHYQVFFWDALAGRQ
jgi:hypothetical protein